MVIKLNRSGGASYVTGYTDIQDHGLIGNCRTAAVISISGTVAQLCWPYFDSPSIFARLVDKDRGGHFSIQTTIPTTSKQQYMPSSNVLLTKYLSEEGVASITDFMPLSRHSGDDYLPWLVRKVEVIRGRLPFKLECAPAFDYARAKHDTIIVKDANNNDHVQFKCPQHVDMELRYVSHDATGQTAPSIKLDYLDLSFRGHTSLGTYSEFTLSEGQSVTFVFREPPKKTEITPCEAEEDVVKLFTGDTTGALIQDPPLTSTLIQNLLEETAVFWVKWLSQCRYHGRWRETVLRSALTIKLLQFYPTGAIVAAPTFSLPEDLHGAGRNWDYRYAWVRDSSFSLYALLRLGFTEEADKYIHWLSGLLENKNEDGGLQIMYTIHGDKHIPELELNHLDGHKAQKPVRIGNGAANHLQLDIYGEMMDSIYLAQKLHKPLSYDTWVQVRELVDYVCKAWSQPDLSIWEVRGARQNFLYSKIMCWVAVDRGLRLSEKRSLPAPNRAHWIETRDAIYEEIQQKGFNKERGFFGQSYEHSDVLDSSLMIMPLTFFMPATDPRFVNTLKQTLKTREHGGLTENNLVYRYDTDLVDDGTGGGEEGTFSMCTLWTIEALARAGEYDTSLLPQAVSMLEDFMGYTNHLGLLAEEVSKGGESLGNFPQAFSHVGLISTCFNVDRVLTRFKK